MHNNTIVQNNLYYVKVNCIFYNLCSYVDSKIPYYSIDGHEKIINIVPKNNFAGILKNYIGKQEVRYYRYKDKISGPSLSIPDFYKILDKIDSEFYREISNKSFIRIKDKKLFTKLKLML